MFQHRLLASLALGIVALAAAPAIAGPVQPYSAAALQSAQRAGKPVVVFVHADWCPTCRRQDPIVSELARDPAFAKYVILKLDFDKQVPERMALGARKQSTLIVYRGTRETGRATGIVDRTEIRTLAASASK
jgi:thioredoxin 1